MKIDRNLTATTVEGGVSLGIHESQSRFFENMVGRTKAFITVFLQDIKKLSPEIAHFIDKEGIEGVYRYFNMVKPSLIRVQADEITYHLHIKLRYEIEKALISKEIRVKDLPALWNEEMEKLLRVTPKTDSEGVLQDVHWSLGAIGYFPTYSLGTFNSGLIRHELEKSIGKVEDLIAKQNGMQKIQEFLQQKIHKFGGAYTPDQLLRTNFANKFSTQFLINYLEEKYKSLY